MHARPGRERIMPLSESNVKRAVDLSGDKIKVFDDGSGNLIQAAALVDENAAQVGTASNPLPISASALPLPTGAATSALQSTANTALAAIQAATAQTAFGINNVDTASATVTYVGKSDASGVWLVQKIDTSSGVAIGWASVTNNAGYLTYASAWAARASLTFGRYDEAF